MARHLGVVSASITELPIVSIGAVTNFNQDRATFNAIVSANYQSTTVKFQYNTTNNFASYTEVTATGSPVTSQSVAAYFNATGLSVNTTYYVRAVVSNSIGTTTTSSVSFTTWSLQTYLNTTAGSYTVSVPSITPTGGSAIAPTIYEMILFGAGGGANYAGGGGGGYRLSASHTSSATGTQTVSGSVGAGGTGGNGGNGTGGATTGGSTTLTIGSTTWTGGGGTAGEHPGANSAPTGRGGTVGSGTNGNNLGGTNAYGYYYFTGTYVQYCCATDKFGFCTQYCNDTNQPIYAWDAGYYAGGGGGGIDGAGGNATGHTTNSQVGGTGGTGGGAYGLRGGNGGGGRGTQGVGANGSVPAGSGSIVGTGGQGWYNAGVAGGVTFKYYGP